MPGLGEQHRITSGSSTNPFADPDRRIVEYTAHEIVTLKNRLEKQLGPEYISTRPGASGQRVHYLAAEKCINLANEVFGFNGWSSAIQNIQVDFIDEHRESGKVSLGLSVIVRVTLKDGTYHEDIGYGHIENCKGKAAAFEKAKKEGTTDAMKRALRNFGNVLGNCLYDKDYLAKVSKVKVEPAKWAAENLHRHQDYDPVKKESEQGSGGTKSSDEFDEVDFSESRVNEGNPDEVALDTMGEDRETKPSLNNRGPSNPTSNGQPNAPQRRAIPPAQPPRTPGPPHRHQPQHPQNPIGVHHPPPGAAPSGPHPPAAAAGFYTARAAPLLQAVSTNDPSANIPAANPSNLPTFNPHSESPSIRKTVGVDHSKSKPVNREALGLPPPPAPPALGLAPSAGAGAAAAAAGSNGGVTTTAGIVTRSTSNFVNPQLDGMRRIGAPPGGAGNHSPMGNRGSGGYKPPGPATGNVNANGAMKRNIDSVTAEGGPTYVYFLFFLFFLILSLPFPRVTLASRTHAVLETLTPLYHHSKPPQYPPHPPHHPPSHHHNPPQRTPLTDVPSNISNNNHLSTSNQSHNHSHADGAAEVKRQKVAGGVGAGVGVGKGVGAGVGVGVGMTNGNGNGNGNGTGNGNGNGGIMKPKTEVETKS
ncbi:MAG: DNA repair protein rad52 [Caeruleum heppii]|nr:MAG: DNA repair protein rad52 [Caeruleum heppii]